MKTNNNTSTKLFYIASYICISVAVVLCMLPFIIMVTNSFASEESIVFNGYRIIPKEFSLLAYRSIFSNPIQIVQAYAVTICVTLIGTLTGLFLMSMGAYVIQRKDFKHRNKISFFVYFTTLFSGGIIPWYILIAKYLHLKDSYLALILPYMMSPFLVILMKNYMRSIPESISESAKIDGAGNFTIFLRLILPLSKPGLATIGLFLGLQYWNDWYLGSTFISSTYKIPLQLLLYKIINSAEFFKSGLSRQVMVSTINTPIESLKMAMGVIATGPIIFLYPFVQKYFVKGITVGAVKG